MRRFLPYYKYLRPVLWHFLAAVLCGVVYGVASGFGLPFLVKRVLPVVFGGGGADPGGGGGIVLVGGWNGVVDWPALVVPQGHALLFAVALLPCVFAVRAGAHFGNVYLLNYAGLRVLEGVRAAVFARFQRLSLSFFGRHGAGDLVSRVMTDTGHVRAVVVEVSNDILIQPFTLLGALGFFAYLAAGQPGMGRFLLSLALVPAVILPVRAIGKKLRRRSEETLAHSGSLAGVLTENLQSVREVRAYNLEAREVGRFNALVRSLLRAQLKAVKYERMLAPLIEFLSACSIAFAVYQAALSGVSKDDVIALVTALYLAYEPVKRLGALHNKVKAGAAGLSRLEEVLGAPVEVADPPRPLRLPEPVRGEICFERVCFSYGPGKPALDGVDVRIRAGETVALVGPSGAGKSTFGSLVLRFYDPERGVVRLDGLDLRQLSQADLRSRIALVSQDPVLFCGTIRENILLGRPGATDAELSEAARQAGALSFIEQLPQGWETQVGERGGSLSGGQRQRVAIARAFLRAAPVLILDEATSALDSGNESLVRDALENLSRGRTTLVIAHRPSTVRMATRILVFEHGRVVADGPHDHLLQTSPLYRSLFGGENS
ncbi:MAG: ABC transporter ATP-binding protein/permease [Puniceicoccales bacterium]|nr:ABC transporter ATP-binding protein/permease [Puniceicoccales bacterium]